MNQTLLTIPHELFDGWLTLAWLVIGFVIFVWQALQSGWKDSAKSFLPLYAIVAAVIYFVLPRLEIMGVDALDPSGPMVVQGLAIRGYGVFLMFAILAAVGLAVARGRREGLNPDSILSLCFWMVIAGIVGARGFYIIQKWGSFEGPNGSASLMDLLDMTKGGLVVYGSLVGGGIAALVYIFLSRLPTMKTLDALAPAMMLGLAIGRIGCLMNGCCYGGECDSHPFGLRFPAGSAPYMDQLYHGQLFGASSVEAADAKGVREGVRIEAGSIAERVGLRTGEQFVVTPPDPARIAAAAEHKVNPSGLAVVIDSAAGGRQSVPFEQFPGRSLPIHPTQIYAAINASLLCLVLWLFSDRKRFVGEIFATMIIVYPVSRFLLEMIRQDEAGIFGTPFTISQWFSMLLLVVGIGLYVWLYSRSLSAPQVETRKSLAG